MTAKLRSRITYANVVATLALFLVVAGGSVALGGSESRQSAAQLGHKLKVVKQLVKKVEKQQDTSDQQTLAKLDVIDDRIIDAHIKLAHRLDTALARLADLCFGVDKLNTDHHIHDDRSTNWLFSAAYAACRKTIFRF